MTGKDKTETSKEVVKQNDDFFNMVKIVAKTDPKNALPKT